MYRQLFGRRVLKTQETTCRIRKQFDTECSKSLCKFLFETCRGPVVIRRKRNDWKDCNALELDGLAAPHSRISYGPDWTNLQSECCKRQLILQNACIIKIYMIYVYNTIHLSLLYQRWFDVWHKKYLQTITACVRIYIHCLLWTPSSIVPLNLSIICSKTQSLMYPMIFLFLNVYYRQRSVCAYWLFRATSKVNCYD